MNEQEKNIRMLQQAKKLVLSQHADMMVSKTCGNRVLNCLKLDNHAKEDSNNCTYSVVSPDTETWRDALRDIPSFGGLLQRYNENNHILILLSIPKDETHDFVTTFLYDVEKRCEV